MFPKPGDILRSIQEDRILLVLGEGEAPDSRRCLVLHFKSQDKERSIAGDVEDYLCEQLGWWYEEWKP